MDLHNKAAEKLADEIKFLQVRITELEKVESCHKLADELLRKTEFQQKAILNNIPDMAWLKDRESRFIAVNDAFGAACGFKPDDIVGKTDLDIWPRDLAERYRADDKEVMRSGKRKCVDEPLADKEGRIQWIETIKTPILNDRGETIGTTGIARDITERKKYEERLKDSKTELEIRVKVRTAELSKVNEELTRYQNQLKELVEERTVALERELSLRKEADKEARELRQRIEFILGATKTGLDIIDSEFNVVFVDSEWKKVYGDYRGKKCYEYFMGRSSPCSSCGVKKAFESKSITVSEERLIMEDNRPIQVITMPYKGENGKWFVAEANVDISERKKIEGELNNYRNHLEELVVKRTEELRKEVTEHEQARKEIVKLAENLSVSNKKLSQLALVDSQTGLYNHRYLDEVIEAEFQRAKRYAHSLSIIMLDIDYFKSVNDLYGHQFGDYIIKQFAYQIKKMIRRYDVVVRSGGEEFIIISPGIDREQAFVLSERILEKLNLFNFGNNKHRVKLKVSIGVVSYPDDKAKSGMDLVDLVDRVINEAKNSGGNRVFLLNDIKKDAKKIATNGREKSLNIQGLKNKIEKLNKKANQSLTEAILGFAKAIELKDHYTGEHAEITGHYATLIASRLGLPKEEIELIRQASVLHDLGKIGISEKILRKKSKLTKKEFDEIKKHPQIGADILRPIHFLHGLIPIIFYHHERWDGKGYPSSIKGEEIPIGARIMALADVYQALTSDRPYRKAYSKNRAIKIIKDGAGKQFDPRITGIFLKILQENEQPYQTKSS